MTYDELICLLTSHADASYASFQGKLIYAKEGELLGVRTPTLRQIAKRLSVKEVLSFPNTCYEVKFLKLAVIALLPYHRFIRHVKEAVSLIDNWALCDGFKAECIKEHRQEFLPLVEEFFHEQIEFSVRYALVTLLYFYVEEEYLPLIASYLRKADCALYYVHMAVAWLTAEILVKYFTFGVQLLKEGVLDKKTHNKAIQKAVESYRLTNEQKEFLKTLKIKNK